MRYGVSVPNHGEYANPRLLIDLAHEAEEVGWDGFFVWDHLLFMRSYIGPFIDPFIALAGVALVTSRIRIGTLVTPMPRRRPWNVARAAVSLDQLSDGRVILGVGLGYPRDSEFEMFGEDGDERSRAGRLDEALQILVGLWKGEPFTFHGDYYALTDVTFLPAPVQVPRIPIWVGGYWPNRSPFRRAARWDGVFPGRLTLSRRERWTPTLMPVTEFKEIVRYVSHRRNSSSPFEFVIGGYTAGQNKDDIDVVQGYEREGATWWIENVHEFRGSMTEMQARIRAGPPKH